MMEQREVRRHLVALGREVGAAKILQPTIVAITERGGDDDRGALTLPGPAQIST
jgi:hypothetical protein